MDPAGHDYTRARIFVFTVAMLALALWLPPSTFVQSRGAPVQGDLRLVDGIEDAEGRLEVFNADEWGTVCNVGFGRDEANVACRQLGHLNGRSVCCGPFGAGNSSAPIWLSDLDCSAEPARLEDCNHPGFGMNACSHSQDVDLVCSDQTTTTLSTSTTSSTSSTSFRSCESTSTTISTSSTTTTDTVTTTSVTTTSLPFSQVIDNDLDSGQVGFFEMEIESGGNSEFGSLTGERGDTGVIVNANVIFEYLTYIDRGKPGRAFVLRGDSVRLDPEDPDTAVSNGSFRGEHNQIVDWSATSSIADGASTLLTVFRFTTRDTSPLGRLRVYQYLDEDVLGSSGDVFFERGAVPDADLQLFTIDALGTIGLSQSGSLTRAKGLENASFAGWAADRFDAVRPRLLACRQPTRPEGKIRRLRRADHRTLGRVRGPNDVVSVLAWDVDPLASEAVVISSLGGLPGIDVVLCGDGNLDDGEQCDGGDCCTASCTFATAGTACTDDGDVCTNDVCDAAGACTQVDNTAPCNDGDACTTADTCVEGSCTGGPPPDCNDDNGCTDDSCDAGDGCINADNTAPCDDGDACTTGDTCAAGSCVGGAPPDCDDDNVCTDDSCDEADGCVTVNNTAACDDGDVCTQTDVCAGGQCNGSNPLVCDDGDPCTDDSCDALDGCVATDNTAPCDDGNACTTADACAGGACTGGPARVCDDGDPCTEDSCDPAGGCEFGDPIDTCGTSCGDPDDSGRVTASDALLVLRAAIGSRPCQLQACDADGSCRITATDALVVLRKAVGRPIDLTCPTDPATQCAR